MKKIIIVLLLLGTNSAEAQILNPKDVFKRKSEQRANQKIDQTVDKVLDGLFNTKKQERTPNSTSEVQEEEKSSTPDLSKVFGKINMGGTPKSSYNFASSMTMKVIISNPKEGKSYTMRNKYMFADDMLSMGIKFIGSDNPDMAKASAIMDITIMDFEQNKVFTFMNNDGKKTLMGIGFKNDATQEYVENEGKQIIVTKTSQTKIIAGYKCDGYLIENENEKGEILAWVSQSRVGEFAKMSQKMASGSSSFSGNRGANSKNYMAYNVHPEFVKMAQEGRVLLGYSAKGEKGETMDMEFEDVKPNDTTTFSSSDYASIFGK